MNTTTRDTMATVAGRRTGQPARRGQDRSRGLTLVELLSVMVVLATLVVLVMPYFQQPPAASAEQPVPSQSERPDRSPSYRTGEQAPADIPTPRGRSEIVSERGDRQIVTCPTDDWTCHGSLPEDNGNHRRHTGPGCVSLALTDRTEEVVH